MPPLSISIVHCHRSPRARARALGCSRGFARAFCAASALLLIGACKGRDANESRTAAADPNEIAVPTDTMSGNDVLASPELRGDTSWRAAANADRRARRPGAPAATLPQPVVLPDSESLATLTPQRVNAPASRPVLGGEGATVLRAQILLDQAGFSSGALDGAWGGNTSKAAFWYQETNGLPVTGFIDAATFASLTRAAGNRPAVARYTVTATDVAGPFTKIPTGPYAQAKLDCLCYENAWELLSERFHVTRELLARLNPGIDTAATPQAGVQLWVPNVQRAALAPTPAPAAAAAGDSAPPRVIAQPAVARIVISKRGNYLQALDAAGRVLAHFPSTLGNTFDPSPDGAFAVTRVARNPDFHYNPALYAEVPDSRADAYLKPGPNSPVGVVWMALSKPHYGIHGTASPSTIGYADSHGCVRLTNWDVSWLADHTPDATPVEFRP